MINSEKSCSDCQRRYVELRLREERVRLVGCCQDADLHAGQYYRVEFADAQRFAEVVRADFNIREQSKYHLPCRVLHRVGKSDLEAMSRAAELEDETRRLFNENLEKLPLKLVGVSAAVEGDLVTVIFTTPERVDYRRLVAILARELGVRVQMRQVGVRDEASRLGGYASCGRELCCASWMKEFTPVTIKMAKQQDLVLNPARISGLCGRLMCCLSHENDLYTEVQQWMPERGEQVELKSGGSGFVKKANTLKGTVILQLRDGNRQEVPVSQLRLNRKTEENEQE
ncbi:stage 0 sporulation protein [bacterium]|nr:stage 0 sporulation protein [bacterium]